MKLTVTNRDDYIKSCEVSKLPITYNDSSIHNLFGNEIRVYDDIWMRHIHLKITDICNARCDFCVEQNCVRNENGDAFLRNVDLLLKEMQDKGLLYSVSVTGGEPTTSRYLTRLFDILRKYDIGFLTMNTNGYALSLYLDYIDGLFDFVNISRHSVSDEKNDEIFGTSVLTKQELQQLKSMMKHTKMRIQCVMSDVVTIEEMNEFINSYSFADDISFRRLMELGDEYGINYDLDKDGYNKCLKYAFDNWEFKEQTIQDYYVYEIYNNGKTDITFSYSNMAMLRKVEQNECDKDFYREFIVHPDGTVSGSWRKDTKILLDDIKK